MSEVLTPKRTTGNSSPAAGPATGKPDGPSRDWARSFQEVLTQERESLDRVAAKLAAEPEAIARACSILNAGDPKSGGSRRVVVSGVGKAGIVARKVAATLSSVGTAATFLHPVEALHGDLGFVQPRDAGLLFSYSGETAELTRLANELKRLPCPLVAVTRSRSSTLGKLADACVEMGEVREACHLGLAPTSSTTAMVAIGDALALAVAGARGFRLQDFAANHPAGSLGLRFRGVREVMRTGPRVVRVAAGSKVREVIRAVSNTRTGAAVLVHADGALLGIFTDGDLRRALLNGGDVLDREVEEFSSIPCRSIAETASVADALKLFHDTRIEELPVVEPTTQRVLGLLCLKDIAGL